ncbi:MAG: hypothetical protein JNM84_14550 [Planctomycetes bacterium]|nr:hypothetical protein [Planctomycetota bacterium]
MSTALPRAAGLVLALASALGAQEAPRFVPNLGQWSHAARFVARTGGVHLGLEEQRASIALRSVDPDGIQRGHLVRFDWSDPAAKPALRTGRLLPGEHHYFLGADASRWRSQVPGYAEVRVEEVRAGIDLRWRAEPKLLAYDVHVAPGAALDALLIRCEGALGIAIEDDGRLAITTSIGVLHQTAPVAWQIDGEVKLPRASRFVRRGEQSYGFEVQERSPHLPLVIDPGFVFSTFLGSSEFDELRSLAVDASGDPLIAGETSGANFPTTPGAFASTHASGGIENDFVITKLNADGRSLIWSTFVGGSSGEFSAAASLAIGAQDEVVIAGFSTSLNYPVTAGAFQANHRGGGTDGVVTKLSADGSSLVFSTYLGGTSSDAGRAAAITANGDIYVGGNSSSSDFPRVNALGNTFGGVTDAFLTKFTPTGTALFSRYVGGSFFDACADLELAANGDPILVILAGSTNLPTTAGAFDRTHNGRDDLYVLRLVEATHQLVFGTYLGGREHELPVAAEVAPSGAIFVVAESASPDFPTTPGALNPTPFGNVLAALSGDGSQLLYGTYLTGDFGPATALAIDSYGAAIVGGLAIGPNTVTTPGAVDRQYFHPPFNNFQEEALILQLSPNGSARRYATFLGGAGNDRVRGLASDGHGGVIVLALAQDASFASPNQSFPTTPGAFQSSNPGQFSGVVAHLDLLPIGVERVGRPSEGCAGRPLIGVRSQPHIGNASFALDGARAPQSTAGSLLLSLGTLPVGLPIVGIELWVDPTAPLFVSAFAGSDAHGHTLAPLPLAIDPTILGASLAAQYLWIDGCGAQGLSATDALRLTVQPTP